MRLIIDLDTATVLDFMQIKNLSEEEILLISSREDIKVPNSLLKLIESKTVTILTFKGRLEKNHFIAECASNSEFIISTDKLTNSHPVGKKGRMYLTSNVSDILRQKEKIETLRQYKQEGLSRLEIFKREMKTMTIDKSHAM